MGILAIDLHVWMALKHMVTRSNKKKKMRLFISECFYTRNLAIMTFSVRYKLTILRKKQRDIGLELQEKKVFVRLSYVTDYVTIEIKN